MTNVPFPTGHAVVIASPDAKMRTRVVARLAQRGNPVVSATDFKAATISDALRATATIAIAEALLPADTTQWREIIEDHGWRGRVLILGSPGSTLDPQTLDFAYLPDPFETARLVALL